MGSCFKLEIGMLKLLRALSNALLQMGVKLILLSRFISQATNQVTQYRRQRFDLSVIVAQANQGIRFFRVQVTGFCRHLQQGARSPARH